MASKSLVELLFAQEWKREQEQQQEDESRQRADENYNYERQSHGTLKAQSLTSSGCCPFFPQRGSDC